jgi:sugar lactone lactonase YvrE
VANRAGIKVYDPNGRYTGAIPYPSPSTVTFNLAITPENTLYYLDTNQHQLLKYTLP